MAVCIYVKLRCSFLMLVAETADLASFGLFNAPFSTPAAHGVKTSAAWLDVRARHREPVAAIAANRALGAPVRVDSSGSNFAAPHVQVPRIR